MFAIFLFLTLVFSYPIFFYVSKRLKIDLIIFNLFFSFKFIYLLLHIYGHLNNFGTDAMAYFHDYQKYDFDSLPISDNLIYGINYFFIKFFYLNYPSLNVLTFFISFFSFLLLLSLVEENDNYQKVILYIIFLLPSLNFYTSGLNKDMLIFSALSFYVFSLYYKHNYLVFLSILIVFLIRPYVAFAILFAVIVSSTLLTINKTILNFKPENKKYILRFVLLFIFVLLMIYIISDLYLGSFGKLLLKGDLMSIINNLQTHYSDTNLGINPEENPLNRIYNYLFYPSLWHQHRYDFLFMTLIFENTFLLSALLFGIFNLKFKKQNFYIYCGFLSFVFLLIILSTVTSNYGIAFRQKWMIIPFLLIIISRKKLKDLL